MYLKDEFPNVGNGTLLVTSGTGSHFITQVSDLTGEYVVWAQTSVSERQAAMEHGAAKERIETDGVPSYNETKKV